MTAVTLREIAASAGVSLTTAARVFNGAPHVSDRIRERVLETAKTLRYRPNLAARALAAARAYVVALFYCNASVGEVCGFQLGAMNRCREAGFHLLPEQLDQHRAERQAAALLSAVQLDGVILTPPLSDSRPLLDLLTERGMPHVRIAPASDLERGPCVYTDERRAAYEMTTHLQRLGHERIAYVQGRPDHAATSNRYRGFCEAMADAGLDVRPEWVQPGDFSFRSGVDAGDRLLNAPERPTAVFAGSDEMALGVMSVAGRMRLALPKALSVAGFGDSPIAQVVWPQLTTVRQPMADMAAAAASMLTGAIGLKNGARLLDFALIVRGSTGPCAN